MGQFIRHVDSHPPVVALGVFFLGFHELLLIFLLEPVVFRKLEGKDDIVDGEVVGLGLLVIIDLQPFVSDQFNHILYFPTLRQLAYHQCVVAGTVYKLISYVGGFSDLIDQKLQEHDEDQLETHQQVVLDIHTTGVKYLIGQR